MLHSSLALAKAASSCAEGIERTRENLQDLYRGNDDVLVPLVEVLDRSGLDDAIWALRAVPLAESREAERVGRHFAADCVEDVLAGLETISSLEEEIVAKCVGLARRRADGAIERADLAVFWRSSWLPARDGGKPALILRAAKACLFPSGVSEAARHAAVCAGRAAIEGEDAARRRQSLRFREWLLGQAAPFFPTIPRSSGGVSSYFQDGPVAGRHPWIRGA